MKSSPSPNALEDFSSYDVKEVGDISNFVNSIVVPRPIALVTSRGVDGVINAAPFSYFNLVCARPTIVSIAIQRRGGIHKDTARNIFASKEFVIHICSLNLAKGVSVAGGDFPPEVSEIELANFTLIPSEKISIPRIAETLVQMETVLDQVVEIRNGVADLILGEVLKVHVHKDILNSKGVADLSKLNPLSRLSGISFGKTEFYTDIPRGL